MHPYSIRERCIEDLLRARDIFGSRSTTKLQYDALQKALGVMYLHCPDDLTITVLSMIDEADRRRKYFESLWNQKEWINIC